VKIWFIIMAFISFEALGERIYEYTNFDDQGILVYLKDDEFEKHKIGFVILKYSKTSYALMPFHYEFKDSFVVVSDATTFPKPLQVCKRKDIYGDPLPCPKPVIPPLPLAPCIYWAYDLEARQKYPILKFFDIKDITAQGVLGEIRENGSFSHRGLNFPYEYRKIEIYRFLYPINRIEDSTLYNEIRCNKWNKEFKQIVIQTFN
jgi:hypothetical protein